MPHASGEEAIGPTDPACTFSGIWYSDGQKAQLVYLPQAGVSKALRVMVWQSLV